MSLLGKLFAPKKKKVSMNDLAVRLDNVPTPDKVGRILNEINANKEKRELWDSLSFKDKGKVMAHILEKQARKR